jgi:HSP20 family protein
MALFPRIIKSEPSLAGRGWSPFREMRNLQRDLDRFFDEAMNQMDTTMPSISATQGVTAFEPSCDLEETESHYLLSFDIPGMKKENIKIELDNNNVLTVSGERKSEFEQKKGSFFQKERFYGAFQRSFALQGPLKADQIDAQYAEGVLKIAVPKIESTKVTQIKIGESKSGLLERKH